MKVSDYITSFLEEQGIKVVFGYIGGMITHLVDSIGNNPNIQFVQTYHEQTAAIAAEGYAIESDNFGVAISTSGPGVTNMMTGIADAYFDSIPVLYISGQVNSYEYKYNKPIRQQGFQEMDVVSVVTPITKYAKLLDNEKDIKYELEKAIYIAKNGRKGPVLLDIPMNVQRAEINPAELKSFLPPKEDKIDNSEFLIQIIPLIEKSERPMILIGAGCKGCGNLLDNYLTKSSMPIVTSLMGRGLFNEEYDNYIGMIGSYGNRCANMGIANSDLLIVLGSRLDTRQTGAKIEDFLSNANIIHVDIDKNELSFNRLGNRIQLLMKVADFIEYLESKNINYKNYKPWNKYLRTLKDKYNQDKEIERFVENKAPYQFIQRLNEITKEGNIITADIGQNQMWAAQTLKLKKNQRFITSGGLAPMGFSLPVAIGVSFANPNKTIYCINGDGGFHMACQSLLLISQYNLPIKVIVFNNNALGMITQFQHLYFNDKMYGTTNEGGYKIPNIHYLAKSYNLEYLSINSSELFSSSLFEILSNKKSVIIDYKITGTTVVYPKLEFNKPISQPMPLLPEAEYLISMSYE